MAAMRIISEIERLAIGQGLRKWIGKSMFNRPLFSHFDMDSRNRNINDR
jgi:hypothetical protein